MYFPPRLRLTRPISLLAVAFMLSCPFLFGQALGPVSQAAGVNPNSKLPPILQKVGIDQKLGAQVPLDVPFQNANGETVTLRHYVKGGNRPVVLSLVYYNCPMLCPRGLDALSSSLGLMTLDPGKDYQVITVSFDPRDTPQTSAHQKEIQIQKLNGKGAENAWHFLTGNESSIQQLTQSVGFRYQWDPKSKQFAHATALILLTPEGKVSKYFYGLDYSPTDLRLGLVQASDEKIGSFVDPILLFCCEYNPMTGRYDLLVSRVLALCAAITILLLGGMVFLLFRFDRNRKNSGKALAT
ncbi:MAG TPA: SCO family protein [Candidatus Angelobacter sp.]|nr:SCO family protein [Candidatus Angelobacter sp.]